jgi:hypothetical protein
LKISKWECLENSKFSEIFQQILHFSSLGIFPRNLWKCSWCFSEFSGNFIQKNFTKKKIAKLLHQSFNVFTQSSFKIKVAARSWWILPYFFIKGVAMRYLPKKILFNFCKILKAVIITWRMSPNLLSNTLLRFLRIN